MSNLHVMTGAGESPAHPIVRKIGFADLKDAVAKGIDDFWSMPTHVIFLAIIYPVIGLFLARMTFGYGVMPLLFPLAAGFALIGPFAAIGLYEMSRQREHGVDVTWRHAFGLLRCPSLDSIAALGMVLMVVFLIWLAVAQALYQALFGYGSPESVGQFVSDILTTPAGWTLIIVGNGIGFLFAVFVLTISVVSFPLLLDRDVGAIVAMQTSVRAVLRNPLMMAAWGLLVAVALVIGSLPLFVGLAVVIPVLAHSTWHLYRKAVEPDPTPRQDRPIRPKARRYAADFPAVLFPWTHEDEPKA
ncbi:MAG: DUF2189 domain-containing protein [Rhizobiales bacterium]|nr:DUF2189 domain-containing protein [Hyphomicrobiales bacterium]